MTQTEPDDHGDERHRFDWSYPIILLIGIVYCLSFSDRSFWGENEAYYSLGARSVLAGDWLLPHINHDLPADKPPLTFWSIATVAALLGGVSEWTARFANLVPALAVLLALSAVARRHLGRWSALLSVVILGTSYEFWENATEVNTDVPLLLFLTLAWSAMFELLTGSFRRSRWILLWACLGLGLLTKGPVAPALSALVAVAFAMWRFGVRDSWPALMRLRPFTGAAVALTPFCVWMALIYLKHGPEPLKVILFEHNVERFLNAFDHRKPWYYFFGELPINFLPWTIFMPFAIAFFCRRCRPGGGVPIDSETRAGSLHDFSMCAVAVVFVFFSLSTSKRDYYLLPLMPWAALLLGDYLWRRLSALTRVDPARACSDRRFGDLLWGGRLGRGIAILAGTMLFAMVAYGTMATPIMEKRKTARPLADAVDRAVDADDRLVIVDVQDPRVMYYLNEPFSLAGDNAVALDELKKSLQSRDDVDLLVMADDLRHFIAMRDTALYVRHAGRFREDDFYVITNEKKDGEASLRGVLVREVSGLCYHPGRNSLYVVGDEGEIAEEDLSGAILNRAEIGGDLEAIAIDARGDRLFIVDESENTILWVDPATLAVVRTYPIAVADGLADKPREGRDGIEGLCYIPSADGDRLWGVNENDPPLLLEIVLDEGPVSSVARIVGSTPLKGEDLSELAGSNLAGTLYAIADRENRLFEVSREGVVGRQWRLPGGQLEAIAVLVDGTLVIGEESGLLNFYTPEMLTALEF
jgi:4-amino-4-deoxy-L-arabinose transferase-like glycosyltransferase/uncharacterized protein YjiK